MASTKILSKELINMLLCVVRIFMNQTLCNQCYLNVEIVGCNDYKILNETERNHQVKTPSLYYTIVARMEKDREDREDNAFLENAVIVVYPVN